MGILMTATIGLATAKSPQWLLVVVSVLLTISVLLYAGTYIYFAIRDRDALRSETYTLHKMAIEHGLYGDSRIGIVEPSKEASNKIQTLPIQNDASTINSGSEEAQ